MKMKAKVGTKVEVLAGSATNPDGQMEWLPGTIVGEWKRSAGFRTFATPEGSGPVVNVPGSSYREKTFNATWDQIR